MRMFLTRWMLAPLLSLCPVAAQTTDALQQLNGYLNQIGTAQTEQRAEQVAAISTRAQAEQRQSEARAQILDLIGGLPADTGPVRFHWYGSVAADRFHIENVAYESIPNFYVTANVYVPDGDGPFPAVIVTPGHGAGKSSQYNWAANFARNGILALAIDPVGQGERMQHWDPETGASKLERLADHEHASLSTELIGDHLARYFINDGMRGVDYLIQRGDVDPDRIGAFGCSGGGTATAYLAALDPRIHAAATACFLTSFKELFPTQGPQDAEQTIPGFTAAGLDFADWVELAAPRSYAIISTTEDMFPFAGARETYEEAKKFYSLFGAEDQLEWITGPGGHGNLGPLAGQILGFFTKNLKGEAGTPEFEQLRPEDPEALTVTPSGQVSLEFGSETVESLNRKHAEQKIPMRDTPRDPDEIRAEIREAAAIEIEPGEIPEVSTLNTDQRDGYRVEQIEFAMEPGMTLPAVAAIPDGNQGKPAILWMDQRPAEQVAATPDFTRLAKAGYVVLALQPRGVPIDAQNGRSTDFALGPYMGVNLRAIVVGKTLTGMRAEDVLRTVNWLARRPDVDPAKITVYGTGALGMAALHAAALDPRISRVILENTLVSYRAALEAPLHRNLSEYTIPGILLHYDVPDLMDLTTAEIVTVNPVDAVSNQLRLDRAREIFGDRAQVVRRGFRDPLPIE